MTKRKIEIFTSGCLVCQPTINLVKKIACSSCEVVVYDLYKGCDTNQCREKAQKLNITSLPAVAIDGKLLECCKTGSISEQVLKDAGIGRA